MPATLNGRRTTSSTRPASSYAACRAVDPLADHHELVTTEARHQVTRPQCTLQPSREVDEQTVTRAVADAVVEHLEPVDVEEQHGGVGAPATRMAAREPEPLEHGVAVGEAGERVVLRLVRELRLGAVTLDGDRGHVRRDIEHLGLLGGRIVVIRAQHHERTEVRDGRIDAADDREPERPEPLVLECETRLGGRKGRAHDRLVPASATGRNREAVDHRDDLRREVRCCRDPDHLLLVHEGDDPARLGHPALDHAHDVVEGLVEVRAASDTLEDARLVGREHLGAPAIGHVARAFTRMPPTAGSSLRLVAIVSIVRQDPSLHRMRCTIGSGCPLLWSCWVNVAATCSASSGSRRSTGDVPSSSSGV